MPVPGGSWLLCYEDMSCEDCDGPCTGQCTENKFYRQEEQSQVVDLVSDEEDGEMEVPDEQEADLAPVKRARVDDFVRHTPNGSFRDLDRFFGDDISFKTRISVCRGYGTYLSSLVRAEEEAQGEKKRYVSRKSFGRK